MAAQGDARHRSAWVARLLLAAGVALVALGTVALLDDGAAPSRSVGGAATPGPPSSSGPADQERVAPARLPRAERVAAEPGAPRRLVVPDLSIDAPVVPVAAPGGVLTPPSDPQTLGWWADGARPGAARGSALVTGHTVSSGGGAMDDLEQLRVGDRMWMTSDRGRTDYTVEDVVVLGKGELARRAEVLFDQGVPGRLVLITCEDWNGVEYLSNVVVTAVPRG